MFIGWKKLNIMSDTVYQLSQLGTIQVGAPSQLQIDTVSGNYVLTFQITVNGIAETPTTSKTDYRRITSGQPIYLSGVKITLDAAAGVDSSTLTIKAKIDSKIPGTTAEPFHKDAP